MESKLLGEVMPPHLGNIWSTLCPGPPSYAYGTTLGWAARATIKESGAFLVVSCWIKPLKKGCNGEPAGGIDYHCFTGNAILCSQGCPSQPLTLFTVVARMCSVHWMATFTTPYVSAEKYGATVSCVLYSVKLANKCCCFRELESYFSGLYRVIEYTGPHSGLTPSMHVSTDTPQVICFLKSNAIMEEN